MSTFQAVWPVIEPGAPAIELFAEASQELPEVAARHRVRITGAPRFEVRAGRGVPGFQGAAFVVTCTVEGEAISRAEYGKPTSVRSAHTETSSK